MSAKKGKVTRRRFMGTAAAAGAAAVLGVRCGGTGSDTTEGDGETDGDASSGTFDDILQGQVALTRGRSSAEAVAKGIALMNGLTFIQPGQKVMLKPNMTGPMPPPDCTSCEVLMEMIRLCQEAGAGEVIVAERTYGPFNTATVFEFPLCEGDTIGMGEAVENAGATFRPLDDEPWDEYELPEGTDFTRPLLIPRILTEIDHLINMPALKTHTLSVFTISMKNLFGLVHPDIRDNEVHGHPLSADDANREKRMFAQMNHAFHPILNVVDGIMARTTGGPMPPGDTAEPNLIITGKDRVAVDAVGVAVLRYVGSETWVNELPVWEHVQMAEALRQGIGVGGPDDITLVQDGVRELDDIEALLRET